MPFSTPNLYISDQTLLKFNFLIHRNKTTKKLYYSYLKRLIRINQTRAIKAKLGLSAWKHHRKNGKLFRLTNDYIKSNKDNW